MVQDLCREAMALYNYQRAGDQSEGVHVKSYPLVCLIVDIQAVIEVAALVPHGAECLVKFASVPRPRYLPQAVQSFLQQAHLLLARGVNASDRY